MEALNNYKKVTYNRNMRVACAVITIMETMLFSYIGFDENGVRKLKVVNPNGNHFEPVDPDLVKYLTIRNK